MKFSPQGEVVAIWQGPEGSFGALGIAVDPAGGVHVPDSYADRVVRLGADGLFASMRGRTAKRSASFRFRAGRAGARFVCRPNGERVQRRPRRARCCISPRRCTGLRPGRKVFSVESVVGGERGAVAIRAWRVLPRAGGRS